MRATVLNELQAEAQAAWRMVQLSVLMVQLAVLIPQPHLQVYIHKLGVVLGVFGCLRGQLASELQRHKRKHIK